MNFLHFDIEASTNCGMDYVLVQEERPDGSKKDLGTGKYCGNTKPGDQGILISNGNKVSITFSSNDVNNGPGWFIEWYGVPCKLL